MFCDFGLQAHQAEEDGLGDTALLLQTYLGLAWTLGCAAFGVVVVHNSVECRIARQYLCQVCSIINLIHKYLFITDSSKHFRGY